MPNSSSPLHGHSTLWVNDAPDWHSGNGADPASWHGYHYEAGKRHVIAVSFTAEDGTSVRVNFDPENGAVSVQDITESQA